MSRPPLLLLFPADQVERVVEEALEVLGTVGVEVENGAARELLAASGVPERSGRFLPPERAVREALAQAPRQFALYDRFGAERVAYGSGRTQFDPGSAAIYRFDPEKGGRRLATTADLVALARLVDGLPAYAAQSTALVPSDIPAVIGDRWRLFLALTHSTKPIVTGTFTKDGFAPMLDMLVAVRGSEVALRELPLAVFDCCPTSPLRWSDLTTQALLDAARAGVPIQTVPVPMTGATAPVTLREAVIQQVAEGLSGLLLAQLAQPGAAVVLGGAPAAFDMRQGTAAMGAIESAMLNAAHAQVARHLGLPCHGYLGLSDAKTPDYQAGMESSLGALIGALAGIDLISGPGLLDFLLTLSFEKLLLDHEACRMALRLVAGIETRPGGGVGLFADLVGKGQLLGHAHTRSFFREELSLASALVDRDSHGDWIIAGARDAVARAHDDLAHRLAAASGPPLEPRVATELERIVRVEAARAGMRPPLPGLDSPA